MERPRRTTLCLRMSGVFAGDSHLCCRAAWQAAHPVQVAAENGNTLQGDHPDPLPPHVGEEQEVGGLHWQQTATYFACPKM